MLAPHLHTLAALIAAHPDHTLAALKDALGTPASVPTIWRAVRDLGVTVKKRYARPNTIGLTSPPRAWRGRLGRQPGTRPASCFSTKPASLPISSGGTAAPYAGPASRITLRVRGGRPARFSRRCGSPA